MLYMLDTNICIFLMRKKHIEYFQRLEKIQKNNDIAISSIVLSELQYGVANSQFKEQSQINLNLLLGKLDVLSYTDQAAFHYGLVRAELKKTGSLIGANDLLIVGHALSESATLITNNAKEFTRVNGLALEVWEQ